MRPVNRTYAPIEAMIDELARCGLEHAVACPGSRNAPILLSLGAEERIRTWSVLDERSAGFLALGLAKTSRRPVVLTCTSGTAAANFLPAIVEAHESRVPLIVLTADRPPELREVGAGQSIDQIKLYGSAVKWFVEVGIMEPGRESAVHHRALACRAWATAGGARPGPVHLNLPLREPLAPVREEVDAETWAGRENGRPWVRVVEPDAAPRAQELAALCDDIRTVPRGAIVCGPTQENIAVPVVRLARTLGWPVLAEPTSGVRCGPHDRSAVVAHYDAVLRAPGWVSAHRPGLVLRVGDTPTSKPLRSLLGKVRQVVIDPHGAWHEPTRAADTMIAAPAAQTCAALAESLEPSQSALEEGAPRGDGRWLESWLEADRLVPPALAAVSDPFEPRMYAALAEALPAEAVVWVSSSMPIRDVETFYPVSETPVHFLSNRGANGIDGVVSSALGAAAASGGHAYLLTGELALLHDVGALIAARRLGVELTIVCINNGGGGIFDFLAVADHADPAAYERLVATPSGIELGRLADGIGLRHRVATTTEELRAAVGEPGLVEVPTDRARNVALHRELFSSVAAQLDAAVD